MAFWRKPSGHGSIPHQTGMRRLEIVSVRRLVWLAITIAGAGALRNESTRAQTPQVVSEVKAFLDRYCVTCHDDRQRTAGVVLGALDPTRVGPDATVWESVVERLRDGTMPPAGAPRPDPAFVRRVTTSVEASLDQASDRAASPGPPNVRRLNRFEYQNAIRDLLAI